MAVQKSFIPPSTIRPATAEEREIYMKYCSTAAESQEVYITEGKIKDVLWMGISEKEENEAEKGEEKEELVCSKFLHIPKLRKLPDGEPPKNTYLYARGTGGMHTYEFDVDFYNGYTHRLPSYCVLYTYDRDVHMNIRYDTPCKICWIKKENSKEIEYEVRYVIPEGVTHDTPLTTCPWCGKIRRTEDLSPDGLCQYCHKPLNAGILDYFTSSIGRFLTLLILVGVICFFLVVGYVFIFKLHGQMAPGYHSHL